MSLHQWPPTSALMAVQTTGLFDVLRRTKTGQNDMGEDVFTWAKVAEVWGGMQPRSGGLRMATPGLTDIVSHQFFTQYRRNRDGTPVVVARDILVHRRTQQPFYVVFAADEADAQHYLTADCRTGVLNSLQNLAGQQ